MDFSSSDAHPCGYHFVFRLPGHPMPTNAAPSPIVPPPPFYSSILSPPPLNPSTIPSNARRSSGATLLPSPSPPSSATGNPRLSSTFRVCVSMYTFRSRSAALSSADAAPPSDASRGRSSASRARSAGSWERVNEVFVSRGPGFASAACSVGLAGWTPRACAEGVCARKAYAPVVADAAVAPLDPGDAGSSLRLAGAGAVRAGSWRRSASFCARRALSAPCSLRVSWYWRRSF